MTVTWDYNGSNQLQATISGTNGLLTYFLTSFDPDSSVVSHVGNGGSLVLTVTDIGGLSAGDEFYAEVNCDGELAVRDANVFAYGTASTTGVGYPVTWSYDGTTGITVSFTATTGEAYKLRALYYAGGGLLQDTHNFGGGSPGTVGTTLTLGLTPSAGKTFIAVVLAGASPGFAVATRVFTEGVSDTGSQGSPSTGGTDTGVPAPPPGDTTPPTLRLVGAHRSKVTLVYDEALDPATPDVSEFAVTVNGVSNTITGVSVTGSTVTLTLTTPIAAGDSVKVSYTG